MAISQSGIESCCLSPGNHADSSYFGYLHGSINNSYIRYVIADKGYGSDAIRESIVESGRIAVIPYRKNRKKKKNISGLRYQTRNIVERIFGRIKEFRRIATRYDKLDSTFLSFIMLGFIMIFFC